jgi:predicted transcriptional regulator of viral defense system
MNYIAFQQRFGNFPLVDMRDVFSVFPHFDRRRISEWQKKGYLKKIANNFYVFTDQPLNEKRLFYIANKIYESSYVSLETALGYYGLIPEAVFSVFSVSTSKTKTANARLGAINARFLYKKMKRSFFFGYSLKKNEGTSFLIADPEKALLDFLYLREDLKTEKDLSELRLNEEIAGKILTSSTMKKYLAIANSNQLSEKINILKKIYA